MGKNPTPLVSEDGRVSGEGTFAAAGEVCGGGGECYLLYDYSGVICYMIVIVTTVNFMLLCGSHGLCATFVRRPWVRY